LSWFVFANEAAKEEETRTRRRRKREAMKGETRKWWTGKCVGEGWGKRGGGWGNEGAKEGNAAAKEGKRRREKLRRQRGRTTTKREYDDNDGKIPPPTTATGGPTRAIPAQQRPTPANPTRDVDDATTTNAATATATPPSTIEGNAR
jgi:hypothetical protein